MVFKLPYKTEGLWGGLKERSEWGKERKGNWPTLVSSYFTEESNVLFYLLYNRGIYPLSTKSD